MGLLIFPGAILIYAVIVSLWDWWRINRHLPRHQWYNVPLVLAAIYLYGLAVIALVLIAGRNIT